MHTSGFIGKNDTVDLFKKDFLLGSEHPMSQQTRTVCDFCYSR